MRRLTKVLISIFAFSAMMLSSVGAASANQPTRPAKSVTVKSDNKAQKKKQKKNKSTKGKKAKSGKKNKKGSTGKQGAANKKRVANFAPPLPNFVSQSLIQLQLLIQPVIQ